MKLKDVIFALIIYTIFPLSSVFMKIASTKEIFIEKGFYFGFSILTLGIFSLLYQKLLKNVDLIKAYIFKSFSLIWNIIFGVMLFQEQISINMICGIVIASIGVIITLTGQRREE